MSLETARSARSREEERDNIRRTVESLVRTTGQRPVGWFTRYACSPSTRELLSEEGGFLYDSLGLNDDLPYYVPVQGSGMNNWKLKALAGGGTEITAGAYPASVTTDIVQLSITARKLL